MISRRLPTQSPNPSPKRTGYRTCHLPVRCRHSGTAPWNTLMSRPSHPQNHCGRSIPESIVTAYSRKSLSGLGPLNHLSGLVINLPFEAFCVQPASKNFLKEPSRIMGTPLERIADHFPEEQNSIFFRRKSLKSNNLRIKISSVSARQH